MPADHKFHQLKHDKSRNTVQYPLVQQKKHALAQFVFLVHWEAEISASPPFPFLPTPFSLPLYVSNMREYEIL